MSPIERAARALCHGDPDEIIEPAHQASPKSETARPLWHTYIPVIREAVAGYPDHSVGKAMMADWNRVTEKAAVTENATLWLVSAEWWGGYDKRRIRLQNIHLSESAAREDWERLTPERHNKVYGFVRHPLRSFREAGQ